MVTRSVFDFKIWRSKAFERLPNALRIKNVVGFQTANDMKALFCARWSTEEERVPRINQ
ncbi:hypothetical protein D3C76_20070 [compost metagenome]